MKWIGVAGALAAAVSLPARAQNGPEACAGVPAAYAGRCAAAVQTAHSAQPQLGLLVAGGLPSRAVGPGGTPVSLRPRLSATGRAGFVRLHLPRITDETNTVVPERVAPIDRELTVIAVALEGGVVAGLSPGFSLGPGVRVGSVDLLGSVSYLPFDLISREVFHRRSAQAAWSAGARLGVLAESGAIPGVSVSAAYRRMGSVQIGTACEGDQTTDPFSTTTPPSTLCREEGDVAQASVSVAGWSARAALSKRLGGLSLAAGAGYDRFRGDFDVELLAVQGTTFAPTRVYHSPGGTVQSERWSGFLNGSYAHPLGALSAEVGWMQGGERVPGFPQDGEFDPAKGTFSLSLGLRRAM